MDIQTIFTVIGTIISGIALYFTKQNNKKKPAISMEGCVSPISTTMSHIEKESITGRHNSFV